MKIPEKYLIEEKIKKPLNITTNIVQLGGDGKALEGWKTIQYHRLWKSLKITDFENLWNPINPLWITNQQPAYQGACKTKEKSSQEIKSESNDLCILLQNLLIYSYTTIVP